MVAINQILGRTLGFCLASSATLPLTGVMTSIRGEQSVESGRSHYFAEVDAIRSFLEEAKRDRHPILVIDELFRGTNTRERVALARAVLEYLARRALVLVTTHDIELQPLLAGQYMPLHFRENPDIEGFFDYRLRPGVSRARNAIRILDRMGFPESIVTSAMDYASEKPTGQR
ncbi:MAG: MutS-related protein, partial [Rhodanobacteraceae bacterium]